MTGPDPFHDGERRAQERAGERETARRVGAMVGAAIPPRAIPFLAEQRLLAIGSVDAQGAVSASVLTGGRGLASTPDGRSVVLDRTRADAGADDPVWRDLRAGADVGLLAIELETRRRLRINGVVTGVDAARVEVRVREAYPNCPRYVHRRRRRDDLPDARRADPSVLASGAASGTALDEARVRVVERADTLFVASRHPERGADVSHRGGAPGFVRVLDPTRLRIPDYPGNGMFNTLGNLLVDDRAALAFLDFERGTLLRMTGRAAVHFDADEDPHQPTGGTGRYWDFHVTSWRASPAPSPLAWELLERSPHDPIARNAPE